MLLTLTAFICFMVAFLIITIILAVTKATVSRGEYNKINDSLTAAIIISSVSLVIVACLVAVLILQLYVKKIRPIQI